MKVTVVTQAFNNEKYIRKCIESVLNQTYTDFEYILIDNGCCGESKNIIKHYESIDKRITRIRFEENQLKPLWYDYAIKTDSEYFTLLDSDDWFEPDYLERLINIAEMNKADIVSTGTLMHVEGNSTTYTRKTEKSIFIDKSNYASAFPFYHVFFRTVWGKLIRMKLIKAIPLVSVEKTGVTYGNDTLTAFSWLRISERVYIDSSVLHHYRIHKRSMSYKYDPRQSYSDLYLYNDAVDFLSQYGGISNQNLTFLYAVYSNAVADTVKNIVSSNLSVSEKLHEYNEILLRDVTKNAYSDTNDESCRNSKFLIWKETLKCADKLSDENPDLKKICAEYFPKCSEAIIFGNSGLFIVEDGIFSALMNDDRELLVNTLSDFAAKQKYIKRYDVIKSLKALLKDDPLTLSLCERKFLREYENIYKYVRQKKYPETLETMTDMLLRKKIDSEIFLQLYISLAALLECADAFIFGKIKYSMYLVNKKRFDECQAILIELEEMGVEDNDDISLIKRLVNENTNT